MDKITKKTLSDEALMLRIRKYCALRERSTKEVSKKLFELGTLEDKALLVIEKLEKEGFLNENRYVSAYARGKFRNKKWGKKKIEMELKKQGISKELLEKGLKEIEKTDYVKVLDALLLKKWKLLKAKSTDSNYSDNDLFTPVMPARTEWYIRARQKLLSYAMQKGFEYDLVIERVKKIL